MTAVLPSGEEVKVVEEEEGPAKQATAQVRVSGLVPKPSGK